MIMSYYMYILYMLISRFAAFHPIDRVLEHRAWSALSQLLRRPNLL